MIPREALLAQLVGDDGGDGGDDGDGDNNKNKNNSNDPYCFTLDEWMSVYGGGGSGGGDGNDGSGDVVSVTLESELVWPYPVPHYLDDEEIALSVV